MNFGEIPRLPEKFRGLKRSAEYFGEYLYQQELVSSNCAKNYR